MNKAVIAYMMYLVCASLACAGYTDSLWNESEDRVYYDCGDWSGVQNHKNTAFHFQSYNLGACDHNARCMYDHHRWGYPTDARFKSVCGLRRIVWTAMAIEGFDKTLNIDDTTFVDDPSKINYKTSCLRVYGDITIRWGIYKITHEVTKSDDGEQVSLSNEVVFYAKKTNALGEEEKKKVTSISSDNIQYEMWDPVDSSIILEIVNHSNYMVLNLQTPENITGIKIVAESKNVTAIYEKHTHCLKLNTSNPFMTCDLIDCEYHHFAGIIPFGPDSYLLQHEPDYNINVTLYTPFTTVDADVVANETEAEPINTDLKYDTIWDLLYIAVPTSLIIGLTRLI